MAFQNRSSCAVLLRHGFSRACLQRGLVEWFKSDSQGTVSEALMSFVAERQFILATRETGYRTTSSAIAELIDNSLQAGARHVRIRTRVLFRDDQANSAEVAVLDDGSGMSAESCGTIRLQCDGSQPSNRGSIPRTATNVRPSGVNLSGPASTSRNSCRPS
jgi:hypothetical protein